MNFSIVIPALNEEKYIGNILTCLTNQTFKDFEVIVVDGESEDRTKEVVSSFSDRLRISIIDVSRGNVSKSRNKGALASYFDNIAFFDADTEIENDFFEKLDKVVSKKPVDFLSCWYVPLSKRLDDRFFGFCASVYSIVVKRISPAAIGVFMFVRKKAFNEVGGFDESMHFLEDTDLYRRLRRKGFRYEFLKDPKIKFSVRRLESEGRIVTVVKALVGSIFLAFGMKYKLQEIIDHEALN